MRVFIFLFLVLTTPTLFGQTLQDCLDAENTFNVYLNDTEELVQMIVREPYTEGPEDDGGLLYTAEEYLEYAEEAVQMHFDEYGNDATWVQATLYLNLARAKLDEYYWWWDHDNDVNTTPLSAGDEMVLKHRPFAIADRGNALQDQEAQAYVAALAHWSDAEKHLDDLVDVHEDAWDVLMDSFQASLDAIDLVDD